MKTYILQIFLSLLHVFQAERPVDTSSVHNVLSSPCKEGPIVQFALIHLEMEKLMKLTLVY